MSLPNQEPAEELAMPTALPPGLKYIGCAISLMQAAGETVDPGQFTDFAYDEADRLAAESGPDANYGNGKGLHDWELFQELGAQSPLTDPKNPQSYIYGDAAGFGRYFEHDLEMVALSGMNAFRTGISWGAFETKSGQFNPNGLRTPLAIITKCHELDLEPFVTLNHFNHPAFLGTDAWEDPEMALRFETYVKKLVERDELATVTYWLTINEPEVMALMGWMAGAWPPRKRSPLKHRRVAKIMADAHKRAYDAIKNRFPHAKVSAPVNNAWFEPKQNWKQPLNAALVRFIDAQQHGWREQVRDHLDYVGLNHYMHNVMEFPQSAIKMDQFRNSPEPVSDIGWYINPQGLYHAVMAAHSRFPNLPIVITENGLADWRDDKRPWFICEMMKQLVRASNAGANVLGYLHWTLFGVELLAGRVADFGLIEVDWETMERRPRESFYLLGDIAGSREIPD